MSGAELSSGVVVSVDLKDDLRGLRGRRGFLQAVIALAVGDGESAWASKSSPRVVAEGLQAPESPKPLADGTVLVVEMMRGTLSRVLLDGRIEVVAVLRGCPNGCALGPNGSVYVTNNSRAHFVVENGLNVWKGMRDDPEISPRIQRVDLTSGRHDTLYESVGGIALRAPNDLVFDQMGGFYFTDIEGDSNSGQPGVVCWAKADGSEIRRIAEVPAANGIVLSPDYKRLFVAAPQEIRCFDVTGPGELRKGVRGIAESRLFASIQQGRFDSMAEEAGGGLVVGTLMPGCLTVFKCDGKLRNRLFLPPEMAVTSVAFGGPGLRTAFVTLMQTGKLIAIEWPRPGMRPAAMGIG